MPRTISIRILAVVIALCVLAPTVWPSQIESTAAIVAANGIAKQVSTQEWLGPLASVALSPFFGLACLSGGATYGPEWLQNKSALFAPGSPLNNPLLFWVMLGLTITTSLPRLTKVSKPLALAAEQIEMYSAIIILMSLKYLSLTSNSPVAPIAMSDPTIQMAGIATLPMDVLLSFAAAVNIIVINTVKLGIEVLVWLIPVPTIDAILEAGNKTLCASLMALYVYSPLLSMLLNLCLFAICCFAFFRVKRRLTYIKELIVMPMLERFFSLSVGDSSLHIRGFLVSSWKGMPARTCVHILRDAESNDVQLVESGWTRRQVYEGNLQISETRTGLICDQAVVLIDGERIVLDVRKGALGSLKPTELSPGNA